MTPKEVLALCREKDVKAVDLRFMDFPGLWQHFTIPVDKLDEDVFEDGLGFDGSQHPRLAGDQRERHARRARSPRRPSSIRSAPIPTLSMICNIQDPITREDYTRDPRNVARKAVNYMKSTGIADTAYFGPGVRVLHLRRRPLRPERARGLLLHRQRRRPVEPRPRREARTSATSSATRKATSPVPPADQLHGHPHRDDADDDRVRHRDRGPAPRGGHRRPGRDRHEVRHAGHDGRQAC